MVIAAQGAFAAMAAAGAMLASNPAPYAIGDVIVEVVGPPVMMPAQPNTDATLNWPTIKIAMNRQVWMEDGTQWKVWRPPNIMRDGRIQVPLRSADKRTTTAFIVSVNDLNVPVWNVGVPVPGPVEPPPPVIVPDPPAPVTPVNVGPPQTPVETVTPSVPGRATGRPITPPRAISGR